MIKEIKEQLSLLLSITTDKDVVESICKAYSAYFDGLQRHGFSREEALLILSKLPIGGMPPK